MNAPTLEALQRWMKEKIQPGSRLSGDDFKFLNPQGGEPGEARLSVYAQGYRERIREALAEAYETIHHVLGESAFRELALAYAQHVPSHDYNLSFAGRHLAAFLAPYPLTKELPFLPDLARLEWKMVEVFHSFEEPSFDPSSVAAFSLEEWSGARLQFQPSVRLMHSAWPIRDIWEARKKPREAVDVDLVNRPHYLLIYRQGLQVQCDLIDPKPYAFLELLLAGKSFGEACGTVAGDAGETPLPFTEWFSGWMQRGLMTRVTVGPYDVK